MTSPISKTKSIQFRHLAKERKDKTFKSKFLKKTTKTLYLRAGALARIGRYEMMTEALSIFRKQALQDKREHAGQELYIGRWPQMTKHAQMTEPNLANIRNMGPPCVRDAEGTLQDMNQRAKSFAKKPVEETWCLKAEALGPCPPELENIFMFDD